MKPAAVKVLELLYDRREAFVTVDELGRSASLRGPRLLAALEELRAAGQRLEFSPAHGVRLRVPLRLAAHLIERDLGVERVGRNVICFPEVDSTNDVAFDASREVPAILAEAGRPAGPGAASRQPAVGRLAGAAECDGLVVLAEYQRRGRGRQGRHWISPPGANILMSALLVDDSLPQEAVSTAAGLAVAEGVEAACGVACTLHWPNDVCVEGRKLSGVLVEARKRGPRRCLIIGIGINVNASPPPDGPDQLPPGRPPPTDLAAQVGAPVERIEVVRHVLRRLDDWVRQISERRLERLHEKWVASCGLLNQRLTVLSAGRQYVGRVLDVSPLDGLVLRCDQDVTVRLPAETSSIIP